MEAGSSPGSAIRNGQTPWSWSRRDIGISGGTRDDGCSKTGLCIQNINAGCSHESLGVSLFPRDSQVRRCLPLEPGRIVVNTNPPPVLSQSTHHGESLVCLRESEPPPGRPWRRRCRGRLGPGRVATSDDVDQQHSTRRKPPRLALGWAAHTPASGLSLGGQSDGGGGQAETGGAPVSRCHRREDGTPASHQGHGQHLHLPVALNPPPTH